MAPLAELIGAIADGVFAERGHVFEGGFWEREEGVIGHAGDEGFIGIRQFNAEVAIIDDFEAFEFFYPRFITFNGFEEAGGELLVFDCIIPGIDEAMGSQRAAISESEVRFEGDLVGAVAFELDIFGKFVVDHAVGVMVDQAGIEHIDHTAATIFIGVGGDQGLLRFSAVDGDEVGFSGG